MEAGDTLFLNLNVYAASSVTKNKQFMGNYNFYLPYAKITPPPEVPTNNKLLADALGMSDYYTDVFIPWCSDSGNLSAIGYVDESFQPFPTTTFNGLFNTRVFYEEEVEISFDCILFENTINNKFMAMKYGSSNFYATILDFNAGNATYSENEALCRVSPNAGSGNKRGRVYFPFYTSVDPVTNQPDAMAMITICGASSTGNAVYTGEYASIISNFSNSFVTAFLWFTGQLAPQPDPEDPYGPGGYSDTGGGTGTFDLTSDEIDFPALPTLTAVSTGLVSVYTPTLLQLNSLANFLWNANPTDVDWWKKLVANPLDLILGLSIVPCAVPFGTTQNIKVGLIDTGVSVTKASTQFVEVDCGSINIAEVYGGALDYLPFRKTSIYLPFIGTRTISTDDIMGKTVHVKYHIDLLSGACTALVKCGDAVLYQYSGACAVSLPLTGETFTNVITSTIQLAAGVSATVASGGAAAGVTAANAANSVLSMKPTVERAGGVSGAAGQLGIMTPYLICEIPRQSVPENYNEFAGYPSNIKDKIGNLSGFTSVDIIHLEYVTATNSEKAELIQILKEGVIL